MTNQMEERSSNSPSLLLSSSLPCIVFDYGALPNKSQTLFGISEQRIFSHSFPEMRNNRYFVTSQGWVLLQDPESLQTFLWNPVVPEKIKLPSMMEELPQYCRCVLSDRLNVPGCVVVVLNKQEAIMWYCRIGGNEWVKYAYNIGSYESDNSTQKVEIIPNMTACKGKFYFEHKKDEVGTLEFSPDPRFGHLKVDRVDWPVRINLIFMQLVGSCEELFLVSIGYIGFTFEDIGDLAVYKMDFSKQAWSRVNSIGDRIICLCSNTFAATCPASKIGFKGNLIYFVTWDNKDLHIFNMDEGIVETSKTFGDLPITPSDDPFWMLPVVM